MAFINEKISELDRTKLNTFNLKNPITDILIRGENWTIDREQDVFFLKLGGQGLAHSEIPMFYAMVWNNKVISIDAFREGSGDALLGIKLIWKLTRIEIPESLENQSEKVISLLVEALTAYGNGVNPEHVKNIIVTSKVRPVFVKEGE